MCTSRLLGHPTKTQISLSLTNPVFLIFLFFLSLFFFIFGFFRFFVFLLFFDFFTFCFCFSFFRLFNLRFSSFSILFPPKKRFFPFGQVRGNGRDTHQSFRVCKANLAILQVAIKLKHEVVGESISENTGTS